MKIIKKILRRSEIGVLIPLLILWVITYMANKAFFSSTNMISLFRTVSISLLGAIGATFIFACGMMDLSAGSVYALSGMVAAISMKDLGLSVGVAVLLSLLVGVVIGLINALIVNKFEIPAFIATLGTQYIARGIVNVISEGKTYTGFSESFNAIGGIGFLGIPWSVYIAIIISIIAGFILKNTVYGRSLLAVGGNAETARVCGINIKRVRNIAFLISGILCAMAGLLSTARLSTAQVSAGTGWEMSIIAATIIGGVSMYGGYVTLIGAIIGVTLMETLTISMTMLKVNPYWQKIVIGIIILVAVGIDTYRRKKMSGGN